MVMRKFVVVALLLGLVGCSSDDAATPADHGFETVTPTGDALGLAGVWTIDVADTVAAAAKGEPLAAADARALTAALEDMNSQLALYRDGAFVLKNLRADMGGTVTVEGAWSFSDGILELRGHRENGRLLEPAEVRRYRRTDSRLARDGDVPSGAIAPVLRRSLAW